MHVKSMYDISIYRLNGLLKESWRVVKAYVLLSGHDILRQ